MLENRRVIELRKLCSDTVSGSLEFDEAFAASVWKEQLGWSENQRKFSRRISWWMLPANVVLYIGSALSFGGQKISESIHSTMNKEPPPWLLVSRKVKTFAF